MTITTGTLITVRIGSNDAANETSYNIATTLASVFVASINTAALDVDVSADQTVFLQSGDTAEVDGQITVLDSALTTLRSNAQTIGSNVALLQTRLDFTEVYVNELEAGGSKLTLADINEEGANLLALQTRQQLGISALAFAGQAEQGILALFR